MRYLGSKGYKRSAIVFITLRTVDVRYTTNVDAPKTIFLSTLYLFCLYEFTKYKDKHGSEKLRIFNEKYTDSTETALFKKYDGES